MPAHTVCSAHSKQNKGNSPHEVHHLLHLLQVLQTVSGESLVRASTTARTSVGARLQQTMTAVRALPPLAFSRSGLGEGSQTLSVGKLIFAD